jgi:hypothetical protein
MTRIPGGHFIRPRAICFFGRSSDGSISLLRDTYGR